MIIPGLLKRINSQEKRFPEFADVLQEDQVGAVEEQLRAIEAQLGAIQEHLLSIEEKNELKLLKRMILLILLIVFVLLMKWLW